MAAESVDLIVTDPPYASLNKWRSIGTTTRLGGHRDVESRDDSKWFAEVPNEALPSLLGEFHRILRPDRHCYLMCDWETFEYLCRVEAFAAWDYHKPLVWDKILIGMGYHYRASYEFVVLLEKGKRRLHDLGIRDVLPVRNVPHGKKGRRPAEKPIELMELLIQQSSAVGELVFDPFVGSGTTVAAAVKHGRNGIGWDLNDEQCAYANSRLAEISGNLP